MSFGLKQRIVLADIIGCIVRRAWRQVGLLGERFQLAACLRAEHRRRDVTALGESRMPPRSCDSNAHMSVDLAASPPFPWSGGTWEMVVLLSGVIKQFRRPWAAALPTKCPLTGIG